jgi:hypothetical protein
MCTKFVLPSLETEIAPEVQLGTQIFSAIYSGSPLKELGMCNVSYAFYI